LQQRRRRLYAQKAEVTAYVQRYKVCVYLNQKVLRDGKEMRKRDILQWAL